MTLKPYAKSASKSSSISNNNDAGAAGGRRSRRKRSSKRQMTYVRNGFGGMESIPEESHTIPSNSKRLKRFVPALVFVTTTLAMIVSSQVWEDHFTLSSSNPRRSSLSRLRGGGSRALSRALLTPESVDQYPFSNFLNVDEPPPKHSKKGVGTGFYWQIPRSGGTTLKHIMGTCLGKVQAARTSADYCDIHSDTLSTCQTKFGEYVNADPSDHGGIQRADHLNLIPSGLSDVIVSSRILHASTLFDEEHKGRLFTIFRDPIERAVSTFYYLRNAEWERNYRPEFKSMSLLEYAALPDTSSNWMVRWLTGKNADPDLTKDDLEFCKELLRRKFLVLLTDEMSSSIQRLLHYMDWADIPKNKFDETKQCLKESIHKETGLNQAKHPTPEKGSAEYEALRRINHLDLELYEYAQELFVEQWSVLYKGEGTQLNELFLEDLTIEENQDQDQPQEKEQEQEESDFAAPATFVDTSTGTRGTTDAQIEKPTESTTATTTKITEEQSSSSQHVEESPSAVTQ
eukprot:CAMPEP_0195285114 /NCGR_PEP_ID=MMETSP0707-20130614/3060_1 /TAXON_ID=33640 /ORGANISM="Asterionellopsis glacialis, Strain CCMP134" /LENGTH=514 /DNA_ID=CAMNT_0040344557 /DNA_START=160 /DNA_END=1704 /DNA_ORIENTATION=+